MKKVLFAFIVLTSPMLFQFCVNPTDPGTVVGNNCPDPPVRVPIDRIRLKGSPRAIITWNSDTQRDTSGAFWNLGRVQFVTGESGVKVKYLTVSGEDINMAELLTDGMKMEVGLFSYRFLEGEFKDQIVLITNKYSDPGENIKVRFFKVKEDAPYIEEVSVEPPHMADHQPDKCFLDMSCGKFNFYKDEMYRDLFRSLKYTDEVVSGTEY